MYLIGILMRKISSFIKIFYHSYKSKNIFFHSDMKILKSNINYKSKQTKNFKYLKIIKIKFSLKKPKIR